MDIPEPSSKVSQVSSVESTRRQGECQTRGIVHEFITGLHKPVKTIIMILQKQSTQNYQTVAKTFYLANNRRSSQELSNARPAAGLGVVCTDSGPLEPLTATKTSGLAHNLNSQFSRLCLGIPALATRSNSSLFLVFCMSRVVKRLC